MRIVSWVFYGLAALAAIAGCVFYIYVSSLACAFGSLNGRCRIKAPWELGSEDMQFMVLYPLSIVLALTFIGWLFGRDAD